MLVVGGVAGMEMWARWAHKVLWHDFQPGWALHKSHHVPRVGPFEVCMVAAAAACVRRLWNLSSADMAAVVLACDGRPWHMVVALAHSDSRASSSTAPSWLVARSACSWHYPLCCADMLRFSTILSCRPTTCLPS
jgi:hypothetical protein